MGKTIIRNTKNNLNINLKELFAYKDLFITLTFRDFKVRYAQTFLGFFWVLVQPIITLLIFIFVFGKVIKVNTSDIPYPLFALAGLSAWNYFSFVVSQSGSSLIGAQAMISKIYFPRLILPTSKAVTGLIDFTITILLLFSLMAIYSFHPDIKILFLPVFILATLICALTAGIWLSALTIRYRDFQVIIPFLIQAGLFITPVAYPINLIDDKYKLFFYLNPMTAIIQGFRWCLFGVDPPGLETYFSFFFVIVLFIGGLYYFRRTERLIADII